MGQPWMLGEACSLDAWKSFDRLRKARKGLDDLGDFVRLETSWLGHLSMNFHQFRSRTLDRKDGSREQALALKHPLLKAWRLRGC